MIGDVFVHQVNTDSSGLRRGQHALFVAPTMGLVEQPSAYLAHLAKNSASLTTCRNYAYALSYWFNFCIAAGIDWELASIDDLFDYKESLATTVSPQTYRYRAERTVEQYLVAVIEFYEYSCNRGLYSGDIRKVERKSRSVSADSDPLAHTRRGARKFYRSAPIKIGYKSSSTIIKPLSIQELRKFLSVLGEHDPDTDSVVRDRLIFDWGWAVGLRISEMLGLDVNQICLIETDSDAPWIHHPVLVLGKGHKLRQVAVPSWLINNTQNYIKGERARCVDYKSYDEGLLFVTNERSSKPGRTLSARRVENIFSETCMSAGLCAMESRFNPETNERLSAVVPTHCVHDLRHTFAVLTYHAEVAQGNPEPWKKIQAQLGHASLKTTVDIYLEYVCAHNDFRHASVRELIGLPAR